MLTLEFKVTFTQQQRFLVDRWMEQLRTVWNRGKAELDVFDEFTGTYSKGTKEYAPCCPVPWKYRNVYLDSNGAATSKDGSKAKITAPYSDLLDEKSLWYQKKLTRVRVASTAEKKSEWGWKAPVDSPNCCGYSCPIVPYYKKPLIKSPNAQAAGGLGQVIKSENIGSTLDAIARRQSEFHNQSVPKVPYKYMQGYIEQLSTSWQEYKKSLYNKSDIKRGRPKFKGIRDTVSTLIYCNSQNKGVRPVVIHPTLSDRLRGVPGLGVVKCKGLGKRWRNQNGGQPDILTLKITKRPSGYYIQMVGDISKNLKLGKPGRAVGIDPGVRTLLALSNGKTYKNPKFLKNTEKHRIKLEKQLAAKRIHRFILWLNHPDTTPQDLCNLCPAISLKNASTLLSLKPKTELLIQQVIGGSSMNSLKYGIPKSNAIAQLEKRIARSHEKVAQQRLKHDHKLTTYIVRTYDKIAVEATDVKRLTAKTKPILREDGKGYEQNGAEAKTNLNKDILDASFGRKKALLKQKYKDAGRKCFEIPAPYTSQDCPVCGNQQPPDLDRVFRCSCLWQCDEDINAGINMIMSVYDQGATSFESLSFPVQKVLNAREEWRKIHGVGEKPRKRRKKGISDDAA